MAERAWLVGGALRDRLLGRATVDYDVAIDGDPAQAARTLARSARGHAFALSEGFGAWRVVSRDDGWQVDLLPLGGRSIEGDLANRDLTINALAQPLGGDELVDPFGGREDLRERRLRMVSREAFARDPLRTLRLARLACELGFSVDADTAAVAAASAEGLREVAPERTFAELKRIVAAERVLEGIRLMDELKATEVVLPEVSALRGVEQSPYHHLDVYDHTYAVLEATVELERDPALLLGPLAHDVSEMLTRPLANELSGWSALRFGALLHDIGKPPTHQVTDSGRVTFIGHDAVGADLAGSVLARLRASERLREHVAALTRHHLLLGFLVHEMPLSRRTIYRYLRTTAPVQVQVTVLSVADRLATRGEGSGPAIARHLELARQLLGEALKWVAAPPRPPVSGHDVARALGIAPGPEMGRILAELEEASFAGELDSPEEAIERARELWLR
jgi:putative nucleotidyltransferase with HDIG domain